MFYLSTINALFKYSYNYNVHLFFEYIIFTSSLNIIFVNLSSFFFQSFDQHKTGRAGYTIIILEGSHTYM
jgi:hypothetical protein